MNHVVFTAGFTAAASAPVDPVGVTIVLIVVAFLGVRLIDWIERDNRRRDLQRRIDRVGRSTRWP